MHCCRLWGASAALVATLAAGAAEAGITTPRQFEVDIVFPHNETYKPADTMPIVLAIQNTSVALSLGGFDVFWQIRQLVGGQFNSTVSGIMDHGNVRVYRDFSNKTSSPVFAVGFTNITKWIRYGVPVPPATTYTPAVNDRYLLQWSLQWDSLLDACDEKDETYVGGGWPTDGALTFNIQTLWGRSDGTGWQGEIQDVQAGIPECPEFGGIVQIGPPLNATEPACADVEMLEARQGTPCAVRVDQAAASSISSLVSYSASSSISRWDPPATPTAAVASTSKAAGAGLARPVQTPLAAACVLCGLTL